MARSSAKVGKPMVVAICKFMWQKQLTSELSNTPTSIKLHYRTRLPYKFLEIKYFERIKDIKIDCHFVNDKK